MSKNTRARAAEPTAHVDLEYPSSVPTFTVNPTQLSSSSTPLPWFSAFGRKDASAPLPSEIDPKYSDPAYYSSSATYGKNGRNTSHTAKKPEGHIKRPPNCFLLFRSHVKESGIRIPEALKPIIKEKLREKRKEQKPNGDDDDESDDDDDNDDDEQSVSKISGILWDFLPAAEKSFFRARAAHAKAMHKKLYPNYKYSPQVKDKTVKRRVGKKMAAEKRERLEEVATVLVREMGWATEGEVKQRSQTPSVKAGTPALEVAGPSTSIAPGETVFGVAGYEHQHPHLYNRTAPPHPTSAFETGPMGVPMGTAPMDPYNPPRMERRTSSCPPPNAHLSWAEVPPTHTPPASTSYAPLYPQQQMYPPSAPQSWGNYAPVPAPQSVYPPPTNGAYVRPGGKTIRKMRTGPSSAKSQLLNGKPGGSKKNHQRGASSSTSAAPSPAPPTLPSLPTALTNMIAPTPLSEVPMTTGVASAFDAPENGWSFQPSHYDQSQHSSPQTFSSSAPPSVLLETPPFHPQLQHSTYAVSQQPAVYDPSYQASQQLQQQQFGDYSIQPTQPAQAYSFVQPAPAAKEDQGELQLTIVDPNYTFPPLNPSPTGSPRSGSPPRAPSQRDTKNARQFTRQHHHSPLGKQTMTVRDRKVNRLNTASPERAQTSAGSPYTPSSATAVAPNAVPLLSPTPITPISSVSLHQQAGQSQQQAQSLDDIGIEFSLSLPANGDPSTTEFHFPGGEGAGLFDGYGLLGGANANVLLGDVALGVHEDAAQGYVAQYQSQAFGGQDVGPLGVPLDALYGATEDAGAGPLLEPFDPSHYIADGQDDTVAAPPVVDLSTAVQDELPMTSAQQLEYDMMEWRRASEGQQGAQEGAPRRASVMLSQALGGEVGFALYGFDANNAAPAPAAADASAPRGGYESAVEAPPVFNMGFDFQNDIQFGNHPHSVHPSASSYSNAYGQGPLGTVVEERERASSEEADDNTKRFGRDSRGQHWVASSA
ncbi:hypothetical protein FRB90_011796 [Tulasnella sp. 427]|nr:hypothetical protein FRB90_011796 [Tulasnella sp. 427]